MHNIQEYMIFSQNMTQNVHVRLIFENKFTYLYN